MEDLKKIYREGETGTKKAAREIDGHDVSDDIGNAGDEIRKNLGNAGDDLKRGERDSERELDRKRTETSDY